MVAHGVVGHDGSRIRARWLVALGLAVGGTFAGWFGPLQILLAKQADGFFPADKQSVLGLVALVGAAVSAVANPLWGALSDRTTARLGMRTPWVIGGALGGVAGLLVLASATGLPAMIAGWGLVQLALNAPLAALAAAIPDQVPVARRGLAGGFFGLSQALGVVLGTGLAVAGGSVTGGYLACAAFVLVAPVPYVLLRQDVLLPAARRPPWRWRAFLTGFWISPRAHPDFAWAWLTRLLINLSNSIAMVYLLFYLQDAVHLANASSGVLVLTGLDVAALLVTVVLVGIWSDRTGRRRVFVTGAGLLVAGATLTLALWPTWTGALVAAVALTGALLVYRIRGLR